LGCCFDERSLANANAIQTKEPLIDGNDEFLISSFLVSGR
jgi:hypothetical protein